MAKIKKKTSHIQVSEQKTTQANEVLDRYHEIARNLHESTNQTQAEAALADINNMTEGAQMALNKKIIQVRTGNKRTADNFFAEMETPLDDVETKDCSLAQARRLILEALDVNKRKGTQPHTDYRLNSSLINQLILEAPGLEEDDLDEEFEPEEEDEDTIDLRGLSPSEVVVNFVEFWVNGDFELASE